jgi:hypothetical protein
MNRFILDLAVKNICECQKDRRCAHWAMLRAVADAVAVWAQVSTRQGDMLHGDEFHWFTPKSSIMVSKSAHTRDVIDLHPLLYPK